MKRVIRVNRSNIALVTLRAGFGSVCQARKAKSTNMDHQRLRSDNGRLFTTFVYLLLRLVLKLLLLHRWASISTQKH
jgi:hypothetical protein